MTTTVNAGPGSAVARIEEALIREGCNPRKGQALCPAHDDRYPSLSFKQGNTGVLVTCHAGCSIEDILVSLDMTKPDLFDDPKRTSANHSAVRNHTRRIDTASIIRRIVAVYPYEDENGDLLYEMVRYEPKDFRFRRPDGRGGWIWKQGDTRLVLYHQPEVLKAIANGDTIFIVEGERDADRLQADGFTATSAPFGAGKWNSQFAELLDGAVDVVIVADKDEPGLKHAADVNRSIVGVVDSVKIAQARAGKDISDHLDAGFAVEELEQLEPGELPMADDTPATSDTPPTQPALFRRYTMSELMSEPDDFEWLIGGLLAQPTYGQIAGELKTLKSYLSGFIAVGLAAGVPIFDHFTPKQARPVLEYVGEGGRNLWKRRMRRICSAMGVSPGDLDLHPCFDVAPIQSEKFQDSLRRDLEEIEPALTLLDPLYTYHGTATKASDLHQEGALLNQLSTPCMDLGSSLMVANHFNQTGSGGGLKRITMAGSGEWADSWILVGHREPPDVELGIFHLRMDIGSRQWGGMAWDLDLDIGRFDMETGSHDGEIAWDLNRASATSSKQARSATDRARLSILDVLADMPFELTKTELMRTVGGNNGAFRSAHTALVEDGRIRHNLSGESGHERPRWGLAVSSDSDTGHSVSSDSDTGFE